MKRYFLPTLFLFMSAQMFAQTVGDVLKYSSLRPSGTARYLGTGSSMGAIGADFSTLSSNPAGLALFRSDQFTVTPGLKFAHTNATLPGSETLEEDRSAFGFDNLGIVFNTHIRDSRWKTFNVGLGFNRQRNFNQSVFYTGNGNGTILTGFLKDTKQLFTDNGTLDDLYALYPHDAGLAWKALAIYDPIRTDNVLEATYDFENTPDANIARSQALTTFGSMNEMVLSFAGNYDEKLMIGATIGVPFVNYRLEGEYKEMDVADQVDSFENLTYTEFLKTDGIGINLKLGVIYKVNQVFRVGVAVHTPTALGLTDAYSNTLAYAFTEFGDPVGGTPEISPTSNQDYKLRTPWRAIASAAAVLGKKGFISADVEWVDYGANRYNLTADAPTADEEIYEREVNADIQRAYQPAMNVRVGGELVVHRDFRLRAGVNLNGKPEEGATGFNTAFSLGAGVHTGSFFLDLGYRRTAGKSFVQPYDGAPKAATDNVSSDVALTLGFKF